MNLLIRRILIQLLIILLCYGSSFSSDDVVGEVIEISPDHQFIQVKDHIYSVGSVEIVEDDNDKPVPGASDDLFEGAVVKIIFSEEEVDYRKSDLITLYMGKYRSEIIEEYDLNLIYPLNNNKQKAVGEIDDSSNKTSHPGRNGEKTKLKFENGVWHN